MADFTEAVLVTLQHEGGFSDDPNDSGGATNMGITQRDLPDIPIATITRQQAMEYYQKHFWPPLYDEIVSQKLASKIFDMGVLFGLKEAVELIQQGVLLPMDGVFGPQTLAAVNAMTDTVLLAIYENRLRQHANNVVAAKPQTAKFLQGWLNRISS